MSLTGRIECDKEINDILDMFNYDGMVNEINKYDFRTDLKIKRKLSNMHLYSYLGFTFDYMCRFILQKFQYKYFNIKVDDIYKLVTKCGYDRLELEHVELLEKYNLKEGIYITQVFDETPAQRAGIHKGDILLEIDGYTVGDMDDLTEVLSYYEEGDSVTVNLLTRTSDGYQTFDTTVKLGGK